MAKLTLEDLRKLRESKSNEMERRNVDGKDISVIIGMGTCGIAAGAKKTFDTFVEALAVYVQKAGAPASGEEVKTVTLAPKGSKPGVLVTDTIVLKAKIDAVDAKKGTVTITTPAGETKTMKVDKKVKGLKALKKGDDIVVRYTEALAVVVEAPKAPKAPKK